MIQRFRHFVQSIFLLLLHSSWGPEFKGVCNPVLSCHSCILSWFACPIGVFIHYAGYQAFPFIAVGSVALVGLLIGRVLCGWMCPFGFLQDLLYKIPTRKFQLPDWTSYIKYVVLATTVVAVPYFYGESSIGVFCRYCPSSALQVTLPNLLGGAALNTGTMIKMGLLVVILIWVVFTTRGFCKVLCPIGAMMAPFNFISLWIVKVPRRDCLSCDLCDKECPTRCSPQGRVEERIPANRALDCVVCHECQPVCGPWKKEHKPSKPRA